MFDSSTLQNGFRVRYLGCTSFGHGKRQVGISILQRPLLELYSAARRRGEDQRSAHPLALTQNLDVSDYGLVVADSEVDRRSGETVPVVTKVITPLSNIVLWASVRFNSRIIKRKTFGAAFVPIACSEAVVDPKSYVQLNSKQRFLVSLTHPSIFACLLRSVATPKLLECHAFVCATAEDAITLCSHLGTAKDDGLPISTSVPRVMPIVNRNEDNTVPWTEEESPSDITIPSELAPLPPRPSYSLVHNINDRIENTNKECENNKRENVMKKSSHFNQNGQYRIQDSRKTVLPNTRRMTKRYNENGIKRGPSFKSLSPRKNVITLKVSSPKFSNRSSKMSNTSRTNSEIGSSLARIEERWEPFWNPYRNDYRASGFCKTPSTSGASAFSEHRIRIKKKDMATMTDDYLWTDASSWLPSDGPESWISSPTNTSDSACVKSPSPRRVLEEMTQTRTMTFSSESEESSIDEPWHKKLSDKESNSGIKLTYFGYECYRPNTSEKPNVISNNSEINRRSKETHKIHKVIPSNDVVHNNRISIDVTYPSQRLSTPDSSIYLVPNPKTTCHIPHGIRSYNKSGSVKNWSNLSQVSDSSYKRAATLPAPKNPKQNATKMIRWSSEERVRGKHNFLATIKRISQSSFRKAKQKTGKLIESFRNRVKDGKKSKKKNGIDYSEDSAYDTSEICLSPHGQPHGHPHTDVNMKKHGMSWSFQDLRLSNSSPKDKTQHRPSSPTGSALGGSTARQLVMKKKRRRRRRKSGVMRGHSSSDSGVEEYHSDYSETMNNNKSEMEMKHFADQVTRIRVKHGINKDGFHRWSQTDIREELGYIP
ncbi:uncharacterized protein LOC111639675 [Centruroides sculpturatus]|uniref:uncharacterized protein LOC111639675 n=1 Tax=Centruroides sculpturatus TaxID=218467 RepID=UPI000C6D8D9D|nr:uncharacterized protein LOC111639675 [Centruroides sculpturatus]